MADLLALALSVALAHDLDAALFCRLIRAESDWDVRARTASSIGLGQINQAAWDWWPANPFDPWQNLDKSAEILRWTLARYGDPEQAVAAYNLGHGAVDRLLARHGDEWKAALPERVQRYVAKVTTEPIRRAASKCAPQPI